MTLISIAAFGLFGPLLSPYTYHEIVLERQNLPPSLSHPFGTDDLGRDVFVRTSSGARISMIVGTLATLLILLFGMLAGSFMGYVGGTVDLLMVRMMDALFSLPYLMIVILLTLWLGNTIPSIILAISLTGWIPVARTIRGEVLHLRKREFILAAESLGTSRTWMMRTHILPNIYPLITILTTMTIPQVLFTESFLSFMGLGVEAPLASWGTMINESISSLEYYPWRLFFPAFFLSLTLFSFYLLGDIES